MSYYEDDERGFMLLEEYIVRGKMASRMTVIRIAIAKGLKGNALLLETRGECSFSIDCSRDPLLEGVIGEFLEQGYRITVEAHVVGETHLSVARTHVNASARTNPHIDAQTK